MGDYERAVTLLRQAVDISPKAGALHNRLGVVLAIRLKRFDEALGHLRTAIELEPNSVVYMNNYSKVTGMLESHLDKGPARTAAKKGDDNKVIVGRVRPKMF
jgi:Flp pilus assembly protein TadD